MAVLTPPTKAIDHCTVRTTVGSSLPIRLLPDALTSHGLKKAGVTEGGEVLHSHGFSTLLIDPSRNSTNIRFNNGILSNNGLSFFPLFLGVFIS